MSAKYSETTWMTGRSILLRIDLPKSINSFKRALGFSTEKVEKGSLLPDPRISWGLNIGCFFSLCLFRTIVLEFLSKR
jgi:hypothetical protein